MMRVRVARLGVLISLALVAPSVVGAQRPALSAPLDSGTLVRVRLADRRQVRGRLLAPLAVSDSSLVFCRYPGNPCKPSDDVGRATLDLRPVVGLDIAAGSRLGRGMMIGGTIGAALGALFVAFADGVCDDSKCRASGHRAALVPLGLGIALGAAFGSAHVVWRPAR